MRLPLASSIGTRDETRNKDALIKNGYVDGEFVNSRPGMTDLGALDTGGVQGAGDLRDTGVAVVGDSFVVFDASGALSVTSSTGLSPVTADLSMDVEENEESQVSELMIKSSEQGWIYT